LARVASLAHAAAGSDGVAARLAEVARLTADTPTRRDPSMEMEGCGGCRRFMSFLPRMGAFALFANAARPHALLDEERVDA
jgi:hypothetical protein